MEVTGWIRRWVRGSAAGDDDRHEADRFDDARRLRSFGYPEIMDIWLFEIITDSRRI